MKNSSFKRTVIVWFLLFVACVVQGQTATNSEVEAIRREMEQMRADYEQRMKVLEERLNRVEASAQTTNQGTMTAAATTNAALAEERGQAFANLQFQEHTESRDLVPGRTNDPALKQRVEHVLNDFVDIGGYFRAGYGRDEKGGPQPAF